MNFNWLHIRRPITFFSKVHGMITIGTNHQEKSVFSGGVIQSGGEVTIMWSDVITRFYENGNNPKNILILGVAAGSAIHAIRTHSKTTKITGIEIDPIMKQIAIELFAIKETKNQKIIIADAVTYLFEETKTYDLIIVDLYIGQLNPPKSRSKKFIERLNIVLSTNGTVLYNAHYQKKNIRERVKFLKTVNKVFSKTAEVFTYRLNRVLVFKR